MARAFEIVLDGGAGPTCVLLELRPTQVLIAAKQVGREASPTVRLAKLGRIAATMALASVDGDASVAAKARVTGKARHVAQLSDAWAQIAMPTREEMDAALDTMGVSVGLDGEEWTLRLPCVGSDGKPGVRSVVMAEVKPDTVEAAIRDAEIGAGSEAAQSFLGQITGPARSIRSVDGAPVSMASLREGSWAGWDALFSVRETYILGAAFAKIHGAGVSGEVMPVASKG